MIPQMRGYVVGLLVPQIKGSVGDYLSGSRAIGRYDYEKRFYEGMAETNEKILEGILAPIRKDLWLYLNIGKKLPNIISGLSIVATVLTRDPIYLGGAVIGELIRGGGTSLDKINRKTNKAKRDLIRNYMMFRENEQDDIAFSLGEEQDDI